MIADQCAVALRERADAEHGLLVFKLLVERAVAAQNAVENIGGDPPGGEAGRFGFHGNAWAGHSLWKPAVDVVAIGGGKTCKFRWIVLG